MHLTAPSAAHQSLGHGTYAYDIGSFKEALRHFSDAFYQLNEPTLKMFAARNASQCLRKLEAYDDAEGWIDAAHDALQTGSIRGDLFHAGVTVERAKLSIARYLAEASDRDRFTAEDDLDASQALLEQHASPALTLITASFEETVSLHAFMLWHTGYRHASVKVMRRSVQALLKLDTDELAFEALLRLMSVSRWDRLRFLVPGVRLASHDDARITGYRMTQLVRALKGRYVV